MKEYSESKTSTVKWLGNIPKHWECDKIGNLFTQRKEKVSDKDFTPLSVTKMGILPQLANAAKTNDGDNRKLVRSGDFVINSRSDRKGSCGVSSLDGSVSLINLVLQPRQAMENSYVHYLLRSQPFSEEYYRYGRGIVADLWTTRFSEMKNIMLPVPPLEEQTQIVRFLDWKISEINKLISVKKKSVTAYCDLRKAVIDKGILHGFKENVQKDSEVYWLGDIPATWEVMPLKRICRANASISDVIKNMEDEDLVTFLPMENVSETGNLDCSLKKPISEVRTGFSSFAKGDVVVAKITPCFENGKGACLDELDTEIGFGTTEFINLRPSNVVLSKYLYMITMTQPFRKLGEEVMTGSAGQKRVSVNYIKNFTLGIPSIEEQKEILAEIDTRLVKIDKSIEIERQEIGLLQELKVKIISDVVTGKMDVRGIQIPEYEFVAESIDEEIDEAGCKEQENEYE
jgi:type I restriction enzyme S subunit